MDNSNSNLTKAQDINREALWALLYFCLYLGYLFIFQEGELLHWFTLILIPFFFSCYISNQRVNTNGIILTLKSFGLEKSNLGNGLWFAVIIGFILSFLQFYFSRNNDEIWALFKSSKWTYLLPMAVVLMFFTAGLTEEFFFRGYIQTKIEKLSRSKIVAVLVTSVLFGIYHLPYAYLNSHWPSHGNLLEAFSLAFGQGIPMGLILGTIYSRTNNNLLASILVHTLVNSLPAMLIFKL